MSQVRTWQQAINAWHSKNFQPVSVERNQLNLTEETGELSRAIIKMKQGIRGTESEWLTEAYKEVGDVFISLCNVAGSLGIDLEQAIEDRWDSVSQRDWNTDRIQHGIDGST